MHLGLCLCSLIPRIETRTRVVLVIHQYEDRKPSNTGRLAAECLVNSEIVFRGGRASPPDRPLWTAGSRPLFLFPRDDASTLQPPESPDDEGRGGGSDGPITLIVPDGTWRQASRVRLRVPGLTDVPCVRLPPGARSAYRLRTSSDTSRVSTMEAIARALGILEGPAVQAQLDRLFRVMVDRALRSRGQLAPAEVPGELPGGAQCRPPS
jgi:DTW domain-containing protein YfiP